MNRGALAEVVSRIGEAADRPGAPRHDPEDLLAFAVEALGFDRGRYIQIARFGQPVAPRLLIGDAGSEWMEIYQDRQYWVDDPVFSLLFRRRTPYTLSEATAGPMSERARAICDERRLHATVREAAYCPVGGAKGDRGALVFESDELVEVDAFDRVVLQGLAQVLAGLLPSDDYDGEIDEFSLSRRERQCVYWSSQGKSAEDTATILGISAHTVRQYMSDARQKLGANCREQLIVRASALGLLMEIR